MYRYLIITCFLLMACTQLVAVPSDSNILESLKNDFVQQFSASTKKVSVDEVSDQQDDKRLFLKKSLPELYMQGSEKIQYKEIFVRIEGETGHSHLGIIRLDYGDKQLAQAAINKMQAGTTGYFSNTKILTKYKVLLKGNALLVIYSETFIDPVVREFFEKIVK